MKTLSLIIALLLPNPSLANELQKCDRALSACGEYVESLRLENARLDERAEKLTKHRDGLIEATGGDSDVPWFFWLGMGLAGGLIASKVVQ